MWKGSHNYKAPQPFLIGCCHHTHFVVTHHTRILLSMHIIDQLTNRSLSMLILMSRAIIDREVCLASSIDYFCTFGYVPLTGSTDINITEAKKCIIETALH
jgi:hypothetical protein